MRCVLGIDAGATRTTCVALDSAGHTLCRREADASYHQNLGIESALGSVRRVIADALEIVDRYEVEAVCLGLAEADRPEDIRMLNSLLPTIILDSFPPNTQFLPGFAVVACDDSLIALIGGTGKSIGVVVVTGTGSIAFGRNRKGETKRVGGWGSVLGDEGSAYDIAIRGLQAAMRSYDGRLRSTILKERFMQHFRIKNMEDLVEVVYQRRLQVKEIAKLAPIVDKAAAEGDLVSVGIMQLSVKELTLATSTVIDSIFCNSETFEIVTVGSVWNGSSRIRDAFKEAIIALKPSARVISPRHEPAYGAGLLALNAIDKLDLGIALDDSRLPLIQFGLLAK